jgi:hypothetical protein
MSELNTSFISLSSTQNGRWIEHSILNHIKYLTFVFVDLDARYSIMAEI